MNTLHFALDCLLYFTIFSVTFRSKRAHFHILQPRASGLCVRLRPLCSDYFVTAATLYLSCQNKFRFFICLPKVNLSVMATTSHATEKACYSLFRTKCCPRKTTSRKVTRGERNSFVRKWSVPLMFKIYLCGRNLNNITYEYTYIHNL